jgi:hypothetical protein
MRRTQNEVFELETDARQPVTLIASFHARPAKPDPYPSATVSAYTGRGATYITSGLPARTPCAHLQ